jgi:hypothetical protein
MYCIYTSVIISLPVLWWNHDSEVYLCQYRHNIRLCTLHTSTTEIGFFLPFTSWSNMQHSTSFRGVHKVQLGNAGGFSKYICVFLVLSATATVFKHLSVTVISLCYCLHPTQGHLSSTTVFIHLSVIVTHQFIQFNVTVFIHCYCLRPSQCHSYQPLLVSSPSSRSLSSSTTVLSQCHCFQPLLLS